MSSPDAETPGKPAEKNNLRGILWMLLATLCLAGMHTTIHHVATNVHPFIITFFRLLFGLIAVVPFFVRQGLAPLRTKRLGMLTLRGVLNVGAMLCYFTALSLAPIADVTALSFTAPLFATLLAMAFFGERVGWRRWAAIAVGFAGTLIVLRPGFAEITLGYGLVLLSAVFWGSCVIVVKSLGRTESAVTITTYMSLVMAPLALIPASFVWVTPGLTDFLWLAFLGTLGGCGQPAVSQALRLADTHAAMPVDFIRLLWVSIAGYVIFGKVPDVFVWVGGAVIFASTAYITVRERAKHRAENRT